MKLKIKMDRETVRKAALTAACLILCSTVAMADDGAVGLSGVAQKITNYEDTVSNILKAIAAIIALVGAFNVYHKMTNGDQDVKKTIMLTIGGCIAFVALSEGLPAFFGH